MSFRPGGEKAHTTLAMVLMNRSGELQNSRMREGLGFLSVKMAYFSVWFEMGTRGVLNPLPPWTHRISPEKNHKLAE